MRVAAAVAMSRGISVFPTLHEGVVNTWTYGPLPLVLIQPAALADNPVTALLIAGTINGLIILGPILLVCRFWPGASARGSVTGLLVAACVLFWPESPWRCLYADSFGVAFGLLAQLVVVHARGRRRWLWGAAFLSMAPLACKQTSLGISVAQVVWLGITVGRRAASVHLGRCIAAGALFGLAALVGFGWPGLSFILLELPARFPWVSVPAEKIRPLMWPLLIQLGLPGLLLLARRRWFFQPNSPLLLPALTWIFSLPLGLASFMKLGGGLNSIQAFQLWLPATLTVLLFPERFGASRRLVFGLAALACITGLFRLNSAVYLSLQPHTFPLQQGVALARAYPGQIWFPLNPLITLYTEGRYYYDEDGIYVRITANLPLTFGQALPHLPPKWSGIALRYNRDASLGIAEHMIPRNAQPAEFGVWKLNLWGVLAPARQDCHDAADQSSSPASSQ